MNIKTNACELNIAEAKRALHAYIRKFDDCKPSTQEEYLRVILNFLSFLQQNYKHATNQLIVTEARLADWMNHIARPASVSRAVQVLLIVDHFLQALTAAGSSRPTRWPPFGAGSASVAGQESLGRSSPTRPMPLSGN